MEQSCCGGVGCDGDFTVSVAVIDTFSIADVVVGDVEFSDDIDSYVVIDDVFDAVVDFVVDDVFDAVIDASRPIAGNSA